MTIAGYGEVSVRPDSLRTRVSVEAQGSSVQDALDQVSKKAQGVIRALKDLGLPNLAIRTQAVHLEPVRSATAQGQPTQLVGYRATSSAIVTITAIDVDQLGSYGARLVAAAATAGATGADGLQPFVADPAEPRARALQAAVQNARRNAAAIASAAGVKLSHLVALASADAPPADAQARPPTAADTGEVIVRTTVSARFGFTVR